MDYEEKVKAYDELFAKAKQIYNKENDVLIMHTIEDLFPELKESEGESVDEKIKKAIIEGLREMKSNFHTISSIKIDDAITWLEKQGMQTDIANKEYWQGYREGKKEILDKYAEAEKQSEKKHKFNIGDIISNGQAVFRIENITKNCIGQDCYFLVNVEDEKKGLRYLILTDSQGNHSHFGEITWLCEQVDESFEKQGEHKVEPKFEIGDWVINRTNAIIMQIVNNKDFYESVEIDGQRRTDSYNYADWDFRLWTIQDANDGDVLAFKNNICGIIICKSPTDYDTRSYCRFVSDNFINKEESGWDSTLLVPATKEQRDLLFEKMHEAGYMWDSEKKELNKFHVIDEGKAEMDYCFTKMMNNEKVSSAWSEEDTFKVQRICKYLDEAKKYYADITEVRECMDWLKSLRPQPQWKPSEEQLNNILDVLSFDNCTPKRQELLISLYEQLKKLK